MKRKRRQQLANLGSFLWKAASYWILHFALLVSCMWRKFDTKCPHSGSAVWWCYCRLRAQSISRVLSSDQCANVPLLLSSLRGWLLGKGSTVTLMFSAQWICPTVILSHLLLEDISTDSLQQSYKMSWINWQNSRPHMFTLFACLSNWIIYSSLNNIYCIDTCNRRPYYLSDRGLLEPFIDHW